jgi:hypothetical protein
MLQIDDKMLIVAKMRREKGNGKEQVWVLEYKVDATVAVVSKVGQKQLLKEEGKIENESKQ